MDLVEMIMRIEEEFEITIPDEAAVTMVTPRTVIDYLISQPKINENFSRELVSLSVWLIIEDQSGIIREHHDDDSRFIEDMGMD